MRLLPKSNGFRIFYIIIFILLIVFLSTKVPFLFTPIAAMIKYMLLPIALSGFFYYLFRPIIDYLSSKKLNRMCSVLLLYLTITLLIGLFSIAGWPTLQSQIEMFLANLPDLMNEFNQQWTNFQREPFVFGVLGDETVMTAITEYLNSGITKATDYVVNFVSAITRFVIVIVTVPVILYYMLKEGEKMIPAILKMIPKRFRADGQEVIEEMDEMLSSFIVGRVLICFLLGAMVFIGFLIIGLPYALLLSILTAVLNMIPYIGPILAAIPCVLIGFIESPSMAVWTLVIIIVAQQIENNLLTPVIYGKQMDIHPVTTIVLLLIAGDIAGILGMLLIVPVYMMGKIIFLKVYDLFIKEWMEKPV
ncbi:AI-2E family transporter [Paenibacillus senegalensis]|uniref:AI-2E family transporter n=1 Tax=Paenibacillus senegalensis TaxID=1465766 RepID=UPI0037099DE6